MRDDSRTPWQPGFAPWAPLGGRKAVATSAAGGGGGGWFSQV